jgi:hypothetical protein
VNNGGCDKNALCSFDVKSNAVKCVCKVGYTNTGGAGKVVCTGAFFSLLMIGVECRFEFCRL